MTLRRLAARIVLALLALVLVLLVVVLFLVYGATVGVAFLTFAIGALVSPAVAVLGEWLRDKVFRPDIRPLQLLSTEQAGLFVTRLLVKNEGSVRAREVEAVAEQILDAGHLRENFIPMPLRWTHGQIRPGVPSMRDIHVKQECLLDVAQVGRAKLYNIPKAGDRYDLKLIPTLKLCSEAGAHEETLSRLPLGRSRLVIAIYDASGGRAQVKLDVDWNGQFEAAEATIAS